MSGPRPPHWRCGPVSRTLEEMSLTDPAGRLVSAARELIVVRHGQSTANAAFAAAEAAGRTETGLTGRDAAFRERGL